jgi:uncharacterized protein (TIGR03435 family)
MTEHVWRGIRKLLLLTAWLVVSVRMAPGQEIVDKSGAVSQVTTTNSKTLRFDVASVKLNRTGGMSMGFGFPPNSDRFTASNTPLIWLIGMAYGYHNDRIGGLPEWAKTDRFDIEAKVNADDVAILKPLGPEQRMLLLKPLLVDRFKLQVHSESREVAMYALVIAKNGPKFKEARPGDTYPDGFKGADGTSRAGTMSMSPGKFVVRALPMNQLVRMLSGQLGRAVVDKTGLTGKYDFMLKWTPDNGGDEIPRPGTNPPPPPPPDGGPSLFTAVQEQLGLKLESTKGPVEFLVVDHVELPSEN